MENPIKIDDMGGTPISWKHPYNGMSTSLICMTSLGLGQQKLPTLLQRKQITQINRQTIKMTGDSQGSDCEIFQKD